jgi:hypothetical protein
MLIALEHQVVLTIYLPSTRRMQIVIADQPALWKATQFALRNGQVLIVVPSVATFPGPIDLPDYLAHKLGNSSTAALTHIEGLRQVPNALPRCRESSAEPQFHAPESAPPNLG